MNIGIDDIIMPAATMIAAITAGATI